MAGVFRHRSHLYYRRRRNSIAFLTSSGASAESDNQPAYIKAHEEQSDNQPAYLSGSGGESSSQPAYLQGLEAVSDNQEAYLRTLEVVSDNQPSYLKGHTSHTDNQPAYLKGTSLEVSTGKMLNARYSTSAYTNEWLYVSDDDGANWTYTYDDPTWGSVAYGKLFNMRAIQAAFEHEGGTGYPDSFDPQTNTDDFIAALPTYAAHGVLGVTVGMQGGNPNYGTNGSDYEISAFNADGTLKIGTGTNTDPQSGTWMYRLKQILEATRNEGMICILSMFYHGQDQRLTDNNAVRAAVDNTVDFLVDNDFRHVIIEIANEYDISASPNPPLTFNRTSLSANTNGAITGSSDEIAGLIIRAQERYTVTHSLAWRAPVSASIAGRPTIEWKNNLKKYADIALPHGNVIDDWQGGWEDTYQEMVDLRSGIDTGSNPNIPIIMNEDDNLESSTNDWVNDTNKGHEEHALNDCVTAGVSWGFMWKWYSQYHETGEWFGWAEGTAGVPQASRTEADYLADILDAIQTQLQSDAETSNQAAYTAGLEAVTDNQPAYAVGHESVTDNQPAYIAALEAYSSNLAAYLQAHEEVTDAQSAYLQALEAQADNQPAYLSGTGGESSNQPAYTAALENVTDAQAAYLVASEAYTDAQSAYLATLETLVDSTAAYLASHAAFSDNQSAYLVAVEAVSDAQAAYLHTLESVTAQQSAYLSGAATGESSNTPAYIAAFEVLMNAQDAYLRALEAAVSQQPAYTKGHLALADNSEAFLSGTATETANQTAYLNARAENTPGSVSTTISSGTITTVVSTD